MKIKSHASLPPKADALVERSDPTSRLSEDQFEYSDDWDDSKQQALEAEDRKYTKLRE